jgi:hypothetical protein
LQLILPRTPATGCKTAPLPAPEHFGFRGEPISQSIDACETSFESPNGIAMIRMRGSNARNLARIVKQSKFASLEKFWDQ